MALEHETDSEIARAVRAAGSQSEFGRLVGKRQSTIREWLKNGRVGDRAVLVVEAVSGISRHDLRPDLYPREVAGAEIPRTTAVDQGSPDRQHFTGLERAR